jgi:hypothetical protein
MMYLRFEVFTVDNLVLILVFSVVKPCCLAVAINFSGELIAFIFRADVIQKTTLI